MGRKAKTIGCAAAACSTVSLSIAAGAIPLVSMLGMLAIGLLQPWVGSWVAACLMAAAPGVLMIAWHPELLRGAKRAPIRSTLLMMGVAAAQIPWFVSGWSEGLEHFGFAYCFALLAANLLAGLVLGVLHWRVRKYRTFYRNLAFHTVLFSWLFGWAFPLLEPFFV